MLLFTRNRYPKEIPSGMGVTPYGRGYYVLPTARPDRFTIKELGYGIETVKDSINCREVLVAFSKRLMAYYSTLYKSGVIGYEAMEEHMARSFPFLSKSVIFDALSELANAGQILVEKCDSKEIIQRTEDKNGRKSEAFDGQSFKISWKSGSTLLLYLGDYHFLLETSFGKVFGQAEVSEELANLFGIVNIRNIRMVERFILIMQLFHSQGYLKSLVPGSFDSYISDYLRSLLEGYSTNVMDYIDGGTTDEEKHSIASFIRMLPVEYAEEVAAGSLQTFSDMDEKVSKENDSVAEIAEKVKGSTERFVEAGIPDGILISNVVFKLEEEHGITIDFVSSLTGKIVCVNKDAGPVNEQLVVQKLTGWLSELKANNISSDVTFCQYSNLVISTEMANRIIGMSSALISKFGLVADGALSTDPHITGVYGSGPDIKLELSPYVHHQY